MALQIPHTNLADIVNDVREKDYQLSHRLHLDAGTLQSAEWRMYTKADDDAGLMRIAYVSDAGELILRDTFGQHGTVVEEQSTLEELLRTYQSSMRAVDAADAWGKRTTTSAAIVGGVLGFLGGRVPGAMLGAMLFAGAWQAVRYFRMTYESNKLDEYLTKRNVKTGAKALASL